MTKVRALLRKGVGRATIARSLLVVGLLTVLSLGLLYSAKVYSATLTNASPNPADVAADNITGAVSHLIKKETVANVTTLKVAAYYSTPTGAGNDLRIRYNHGNGGKACLIVPSIVSGGGNVIVTIEGSGETRQYKIPIANVCDDLKDNSGNIRTNVQDNGGNGWKSNRFFADYPFPSNLIYDQEKGLYKANITVEYGSGVATGGSDENSVNFVTIVTGGGTIGTLGAQAANKFGLRSAYFKDSPARSVKAATQFSIPCSVDDSGDLHFDAALYDTDANVFGDTYIWITEDGNKLPKSRYVGATQSTWDAGEGAWKSSAASNSNAIVTVNNAKRGKLYKLHIRNDVTPGKASPNDNVLSVGIPYDSVYGDVKCDYRLVPQTQLIGGGSTYSYYPNLHVRGTVTKTGEGRVPENHPWEIYAVRYSTAPSTTNLTNSDVVGAACDKTPAANRISCGKISDQTYGAYSDSSSADINYASGGPDAPGTRLCFFTRVQNPTEDFNDDSLWSYSNMVCSVSGISPKVQAWGYDIKARGKIASTTGEVSGKLYGSWGEYAVLSNGRNAQFGSGNGMFNAPGVATQPSWSDLTFAKGTASASCGGTLGAYGCYGAVSKPFVAQDGAITISGDADLDSLDTDTDLPLNLRTGKKGTVVVTGTLHITGNLTYPGTVSDITKIPRIVIIAPKIIISPGVTQIDPWLVSTTATNTGTISTCSEIGTSGGDTPLAFTTAGLITSTQCTNPLTFNGPVIADKIYLYRTYDTPTGGPAELFNLRADNFLASYVGGGPDEPVATTDNVVEVPPRF